MQTMVQIPRGCDVAAAAWRRRCATGSSRLRSVVATGSHPQRQSGSRHRRQTATRARVQQMEVRISVCPTANTFSSRLRRHALSCFLYAPTFFESLWRFWSAVAAVVEVFKWLITPNACMSVLLILGRKMEMYAGRVACTLSMRHAPYIKVRKMSRSFY